MPAVHRAPGVTIVGAVVVAASGSEGWWRRAISSPRRWSRGVVRWWRGVQVLVVASLGLLSMVLAVWGSWWYLDETGTSTALVDVGYLALQTLGLQLSAVPDGLGYPWPLQVARFLGPLALGYAAVAALAVLSAHAIDNVKARFLRRGHVVVCGLGTTGAEVLRTLRGHRDMVAIELGADVPGVGIARDAATPVVYGDAREVEVLRRAGVRRADLIVITCGDDRTCGEVAAAVATLLTDAGQEVGVQLQLDDADLADALEHQELLGRREGQSRGRMRLEPFSVTTIAAERLIARHPPEGGAAGRVAVIGDGPFARALVVQLARARAAVAAGVPLEVQWLGSSASSDLVEVERRVHDLSTVASVEAIDAEPTAEGALRPLLEGVAVAYVALEDEAAGLAVALLARRRTLAPDTERIVVRTDRPEGLASVIHDDGRMVPFSVVDVACDRNAVFGGLWWRIASLIHEEYRTKKVAQLALLGTQATDRALRPWEELDRDLQRSNFDQASDIPRKLDALGLELAPLLTAQAEDLEPAPDLLEAAAEAEHDRWWAFNLREGWTYGPTKDPVAKRHSDMKPYDQLDEGTKEYDRNVIRHLPRLLAAVGYQVVPRGAGAPSHEHEEA
jgi:hypothetical protein